MLEQWGCCHSSVTTFFLVTLPAKLGTTQFSLGCERVSGVVVPKISIVVGDKNLDH
jgi:hypothetical protein